MRRKIPNRRARYAVGYGRPPTSSQFQPGQSGNPQGRPKGVRNASSMARAALERTIKVNGKKTTVRKAAYRSLAERAVAGDAKAFDYLLSLESEEHPPGPDQAETEGSAAKDLVILQDFFDRRRASLPQHEHDEQQRGPGKRERRNK